MPQGWTAGPAPTDAWTPGPAPAVTPDFKQTDTTPNDVDPNTVGTFVSHAWDQLNPIAAVKNAGNAVLHLGDTVKQIGAAQGALFDKAKDAYGKGDYLTAARHFVDYLLPLVGPAIDKSSDQMQAGHYAAGAGDAVGLGLAMFGPKAIEHANIKTPALTKAPNPVDAAAVEFGQQRGIPIDAGTATGNRFVKAAQTVADHSPIGSFVAEDAKTATGAALKRVSGDLASDARATAVTAEDAGRGLTQTLTSKIDAHNALAQQAYQTVEATAAQKNLTVPTSQVKKMLAPLYQTLKRQSELTPNAVMGDKAVALNAIDRLMQTGDALPLMDAEDVLGGLKGLSRVKEGQVESMRTPGQAAASVAVRQLQTAVDAAALKGGVMRELQSGRAATAAKYQTAKVLDLLKDEPVQAYRQAVAPQDTGIELLKTIQKEAPQVLPQIARAKLDDLFAPIASDGLTRGAKLYADWSKLGAETKRVLFPQTGQVQALDHFFRLTQKLAESDHFNTSKSGVVATTFAQGAHAVASPVTGIPALAATGALSKILHSRAGVNLLTRGVTLSLAGDKTAAALQFTRAADLLKDGGLDMAMPQVAPAGADRAPGTDQR